MKNSQGFTLIEIITVIAITSIIAAVALPGVAGFIDDANDNQYAIEARSVYNTALIEQDKYQISTGLSLSDLYQGNDDLIAQMIDQVNNTLSTQKLTLIDLAYFANAALGEGLNIPANSYLLRFNNTKIELDALVGEDGKVTIINGTDPWDFAGEESATGDSQGNSQQDDSSSGATGSGTADNTNGSTDAPTPDNGANDSEDNTSSTESGDPTSKPSWLNTGEMVGAYNSAKYLLGVDYAKSNSKQLTRAYQDYLLEKGYPVATTQEMALIATSTTFYWVPIVTPDKSSVFFAGSYDSGERDKVSTTIVCIDGKYYQYVNTKNTNATIAINDNGSDYQNIIKAANVNDRYYIDKKNTQYWIRIK